VFSFVRSVFVSIVSCGLVLVLTEGLLPDILSDDGGCADDDDDDDHADNDEESGGADAEAAATVFKVSFTVVQ
jgi:hypothetical protein